MLAGTRRVLEPAHKLIGSTWGDAGSTRLQHTWTGDPNLIRRLGVGRACYITHDTATYVRVARPQPSSLTLQPAHLPTEPRRPRREPAPDPAAPLMTCSDPEPHCDNHPLDALGLAACPDLTDNQVREAWRAIAAATHPDRTDGGDLARYTEASAAFAQLRTPWARSEAYADVMEGQPDTAPAAARPRPAWRQTGRR